MWNGERRIDIRQYNGALPTKTGASLTPSRFRLLMSAKERLTSTLQSVIAGSEREEFEVHLGGMVFCYVKSPFRCVQIRKKYLDKNNELRYSPFGISLKTPQWEQFSVSSEIVDANFTDIRECVPCSLQPDHSNQLAALFCKECNPMNFIEDY